MMDIRRKLDELKGENDLSITMFEVGQAAYVVNKLEDQLDELVNSFEDDCDECGDDF